MKLIINWFKYCILIGIIVVINGCGSQKVIVAAEQTHETANRIVSVLANDNITAVQQLQKDGSVTILVDNNDLSYALRVLANNGGIPKTYDSMGTIFKKDSFISSPTEEQARLEYGLSQEISALLMQIEGVVDVKVSISLPRNDNNNSWQVNSETPITASVYLRCKPDSNLATKKNQIKLLVSKSVSGLTPDNVAIFMEETKLALD